MMINRQELIDGRNKYIGKDVVFKSPTFYSNNKATRKLSDIVVKTKLENGNLLYKFIGVYVRYNGMSDFLVTPHEIISIDGQQFTEYDKDNLSTVVGAFRDRFGL